MDITLPLVVSAVALAVSVFTFWWTNIREVKSFNLVPLSRTGEFDGPVFALANGSKRDLLVTNLRPYFETEPRGSRYYPAVSIAGGEPEKADLIRAGKIVEFRASFLEPFGANFAQAGRKGDPWPELHSHHMGIEVEWVDSSGVVRTARVLHSKVAFAPDGQVRGGAPMSKDQRAYNLHDAAA
jgi:hypothetical protein